MRLGGQTVGVIANNPAHMAGALDINASDKAARFIRFLNNFNIPILTLVDVPSEHLNFGSWRLRRRLEAEWDLCCWSLRVVALEPRIKPLKERYQGISAIEVLEHLSDPLETVRHLAEHLELGGWFFEDFTPHADAHAADLPQAQRERQQVYAYVEDRFTLVKGRRWEEPDGGGTRIWKKC